MAGFETKVLLFYQNLIIRRCSGAHFRGRVVDFWELVPAL